MATYYYYYPAGQGSSTPSGHGREPSAHGREPSGHSRGLSGHGPPTPANKTLVVCCDGTWVNAIGKNSRYTPPTNVSRLIRVLRQYGDRRTGHRPQIALYHPGVGSSGQLVDASMGGAFGIGLDQDIREMYQFICLNYVGGDSIILAGFSRGAFTARSVADLVATVGLLTPEGQDRFYDIFEDYENMADRTRPDDKFICPVGTLEPFRHEKGEAWIRWENRRKTQYRRWLKHKGYTRDTYMAPDGCEVEITIKAVAVWDTVGSLGIPAVPMIGIRGSAQQWKFTNTQISPKVENAFQALALDEPRYDFLPSLWERLPDNTTTNLRQVWFPGSHSNAGGGWDDQQMANLTLAWMCDQLAGPRVGLVFDEDRLAAMFHDGLRYAAAHPFPYVPPSSVMSSLIRSSLHHRRSRSSSGSHGHSHSHSRSHSHSSHSHKNPPLPWAAAKAIYAATFPPSRKPERDTAECPGKYVHHHPDGTYPALWASGARPWGLGQIRMPSSFITRAAGMIVRKPGQFIRVDPSTNKALPNEPLLNTNERIHASVRVRLACGGLGLDDKHVWTCTGLTGEPLPGDSDSDDEDDDDGDDYSRPLWRLERVHSVAEVPYDNDDDDTDNNNSPAPLYPLSKVAGAGQWHWVFSRRAAAGAHPPDRIDRQSNNQMPTHGPLMHALPEELPTGRYERMLLGMTAGTVDVFAWAAGHAYSYRGR